ncbi:hypothetical protein SK128_022090 [Halocaridina rubra]|uniref:Uncharacterized protein n=1 Tax=Halocaridina rubra TaxID=373956 RepID=A0AAN8X8W0_HALRR
MKEKTKVQDKGRDEVPATRVTSDAWMGDALRNTNYAMAFPIVLTALMRMQPAGIIICLAASDICASPYFRCPSGICLHPTFFCDGIFDCENGEDEYKCVISDLTAHKFRLLCSQYYKYLLDIHKEPSTKTLDVDSMECPSEYNEFQSVDSHARCAFCSQEFNCWRLDWIDSWQNHSLNEVQLIWMLAKRSSDFSDITSLYTPSSDVLEDTSVPTEDFIFSCAFGGEVCNTKEFYTWIDSRYGKCYTFNSQHSVRVLTASGPSNALRLNLNLKLGLPLLSPDEGVRVMIHSPHQLPFPDEEGFNVGHGSVSISVSRKVIQYYGEQYGWCRSATRKKFPMYSQMLCRKLCIENAYRTRCGCTVNKGPAYKELETLPGTEAYKKATTPLPSCSNFNITQRLCRGIVEFHYKNHALACNCPPACREEQYKSQVTSSQFNKKYYTLLNNLRKPVKSVCNEEQHKLISLHIYLESLTYELIRESASYTWESLVGTLGGTLGLVIGVSVVTVLEALEFLFDVWTMCWRKRRQKALKKKGANNCSTDLKMSN